MELINSKLKTVHRALEKGKYVYFCLLTHPDDDEKIGIRIWLAMYCEKGQIDDTYNFYLYVPGKTTMTLMFFGQNATEEVLLANAADCMAKSDFCFADDRLFAMEMPTIETPMFWRDYKITADVIPKTEKNTKEQ